MITMCSAWPFQIRMQAQGSLLQGSMISNFVNIYKTEGTRGLWRVSFVRDHITNKRMGD